MSRKSVRRGKFQPRPARLGAAFEASDDPRPKRRQILRRLGPHEEAPGGALRHDIRCRAAIGDDAVNPLGRSDVLAQRGDRLIGED